MIRRKAVLVPSGEQGWVLGWVVRVDVNGDEHMLFIFEDKPAGGTTSEQAVGAVRFDDGLPDVIPELG